MSEEAYEYERRKAERLAEAAKAGNLYGGYDHGDSIKEMGGHIRSHFPILSVETSEAAIRACYEASEEQWIKWEKEPPTNWDAPIVGRDALGFVHLATHLIGGQGAVWADQWMRLRV